MRAVVHRHVELAAGLARERLHPLAVGCEREQDGARQVVARLRVRVAAMHRVPEDRKRSSVSITSTPAAAAAEYSPVLWPTHASARRPSRRRSPWIARFAVITASTAVSMLHQPLFGARRSSSENAGLGKTQSLVT